MAYEISEWEIDWVREQIKAVFGNYNNWAKYCSIRDRLYQEYWLSTF